MTIRPGTFGVRSDLDTLVELLEELERDLRDLELTDQVPCMKCIKDLFSDIQRREVLRLGPYVSEMQLEGRILSPVRRRADLRGRNQRTGIDQKEASG